MRDRGGGGFITLIVLVVVFGGFGYLVWSNARSAPAVRPVVPELPSATPAPNTWQEVLRSGFDGQGTPVPTVAIPEQQFVAPTLPPVELTATLVAAGDVSSGGNSQVFAAGATPTLPPPTPTVPAGGTSIPVVDVPTVAVRATSLPSLPVPLSRDPFGWDHYWFKRPVAADAVNYGLVYYEYGTNGPRDNPYPIHTGIDIANPLGTPILAAADGRVIFATDPNDPTQTTFQGSPSYGRVVFIEHDFGGPDGQRVYTLYAHLQGTLVVKDQRVKAGDPIALMGNTGHASGPHVHFEVRMGEGTFGETYNPDLWLAPYVGHGTVAGRVVNTRGEFLDDVDVQLMSGGLVRDTTTTYVYRGTGSEVNRDPNWQENFLLANVPVGRYRVQAMINGETVFQMIDVREGMTTGVELKPSTDIVIPAATATPITEP